MSKLIRQLKELLSEEFTDDDGEVYRAELLPGLSAEEVAVLAAKMPITALPQEVKELLLYSRGVDFGWLQQISFDAFGEFSLPGLFPACIELMSDGAGNFWLLDINEQGEWGAVFYVCHDPQVIIRQANNLQEFLLQLHEYGKLKSASWMDEVYKRLSIKIWKERKLHVELVEAALATASTDAVLSQFAAQQPPEFLLADLRVGSATKGFAYDGFFQNRNQRVCKHELEPIWAFEPPRQGWFSRLFG